MDESVKSADKKPEKFRKRDGTIGLRMVPVDKEIVKEDEQIDELNRDTVLNYVYKATGERILRQRAGKKTKKDRKRDKGIQRGINRLQTAESTEEGEEAAAEYDPSTHQWGTDASTTHAKKITPGEKKKVDKFKTFSKKVDEAIEELDEISKKTKRDCASTDIASHSMTAVRSSNKDDKNEKL